jgi:adenylate kinase family enzyme
MKINSLAPFPYRRLCVVGTTGSGKSTLAENIARILHLPHLELDAYHWQPGWQENDRELTRQRVEEFTRLPAWVVDGNYRFLRDILWPRAHALVWLDYSLPLILWRLSLRTWKRVLSREVLWGTNRERLSEQFFSKDSLFLWALKTYTRHKQEYAAMPSLPEYCHLAVHRLRTPRQTQAWLNILASTAAISDSSENAEIIG